jgi:penicillin-binding protein-related factor A (putative recombinase)
VSTIRGRALELALVRASRAYRAAGRRCVLVRQHAPVFTRGDGSVSYSDTGAPVDLIGAVDGAPWALEAKMTAGLSMPLKVERESQRGALQLLFTNGFTVALVIEFVDQVEVYSVPWSAVEAFERAPWRRSLSLDFCRAYGLLLPEEGRDTEQRRTLFLDGLAHVNQADFVERVEAERRAAPVLMLDAEDRPRPASKRELKSAARAAARPDPRDKEAYRTYLRGLAQEGMERQMGAAKRPRGRRRG